MSRARPSFTLVVVLATALALSCGGQQSTAQPPPRQHLYKVGQAVTYGQVTLTVTKVEAGEFTDTANTAVTATIVNNSSQPWTPNSFDFEVRDAEGVKYQTYWCCFSQMMTENPVQPGEKVSGRWEYMVLSTTPGLRLVWGPANAEIALT